MQETKEKEDMGLIPGLGRSPGVENGNPFQYFCLKNTMDRGAWWNTVHGVTKSWTQLSMLHMHCSICCSPCVLGNKLSQKDNADSGVQFITPADP